MHAADWYVIQVQTGHEQQACMDILRVCAHDHEQKLLMANTETDQKPVLQECFAPRYQSQFKLHGEWHNEERLLLPGYVVAVTADPWELARTLRGVPSLTRILRMGETFAPLMPEDKSWMERWTAEGDRTIPMSVAYKEGDRVVVTEGPLKGHEGMITKVKRRLSLAELEIHAGQVTIRTTVGLAVLPSKDDVQSS